MFLTAIDNRRRKYRDYVTTYWDNVMLNGQEERKKIRTRKKKEFYSLPEHALSQPNRKEKRERK